MGNGCNTRECSYSLGNTKENLTFLVFGGLILGNVLTNGRMPSGTQAGGRAVVFQAQKQLSEEWENATPEEYQQNAIKKLEAELENKIDEECRRYAVQLIAAM